MNTGINTSVEENKQKLVGTINSMLKDLPASVVELLLTDLTRQVTELKNKMIAEEKSQAQYTQPDDENDDYRMVDEFEEDDIEE